MIRLELTDGLGRVWDLSSPALFPAVLAGVRGLGRPDITPVRGRRGAGMHGSVWSGWRATSRNIVLPLAWESADIANDVRDFARGVVPDQPGTPGIGACTLTAVLPDTSRWSVQARMVDDGGLTIDIDPTVINDHEVTTGWDADVFWQGQEWSQSWSGVAGTDQWLLTTGGVALLTSSHTLASAAITNQGDVRAWLVWTITGPCTAASVGIGARQITLGAPVGAGETVTIDTNPEWGQTAIHSVQGDITGSLTAVDFAPVEPGDNTLTVTMTGTGSISAAYRPLRLAVL